MLRWYVTSCVQSSPPVETDKLQSIYYPIKESNEFFVTVQENLRTTHPDHFQVSNLKVDYPFKSN